MNATSTAARPVACTIVARNYLAHARCLADSFLAAHPDGLVYVLLVDRVEGAFDTGAERFTTLLIEELDLPWLHEMVLRYDLLELCTAVKPFLLRHLLLDRGHDQVCYIDPDIRIYQPLEQVWALLRDHAMVLTPHLLDPMDDQADPGETLILQCGAYNLGFLGISRHPQGLAFLAWWQERMRWACLADVRRGYFVDQKWVDLVPGLYPATAILHHPGYNVAYWNLPARRVDTTAAPPTSNGAALVFFHFSGYGPDAPDRVSRYQNRFTFAERPELRSLFSAYGEELRARGYHGWRATPNALFATGRARGNLHLVRMLLRRVRVAFPQRWRLGPEANERAATEVLLWLVQPDADGGDRDGLVTPVVAALHRDNPGLRAVFPDATGSDAVPLACWFLLRSHARHGIHWRFLLPVLLRLLRALARDPARVMAAIAGFVRTGLALRRGDHPVLSTRGRLHL